jgi:hypothetical protein
MVAGSPIPLMLGRKRSVCFNKIIIHHRTGASRRSSTLFSVSHPMVLPMLLQLCCLFLLLSVLPCSCSFVILLLLLPPASSHHILALDPWWWWWLWRFRMMVMVFAAKLSKIKVRGYAGGLYHPDDVPPQDTIKPTSSIHHLLSLFFAIVWFLWRSRLLDYR